MVGGVSLTGSGGGSWNGSARVQQEDREDAGGEGGTNLTGDVRGRGTQTHGRRAAHAPGPDGGSAAGAEGLQWPPGPPLPPVVRRLLGDRKPQQKGG